MFEHDYKNYPELTNQQIQDFGFSSPHPQITEDFEATVVKVHDGDTYTLRVGFRDFDFPIRLGDIDTKELSDGGGEARDFIKQKIEGQKVQVLIDKNNRVGKYGRLLGNVIYKGISISEVLIHRGLAVPFSQKNQDKIPPSGKVFAYEFI